MILFFLSFQKKRKLHPPAAERIINILDPNNQWPFFIIHDDEYLGVFSPKAIVFERFLPENAQQKSY
jgi:hypothetical protein